MSKIAFEPNDNVHEFLLAAKKKLNKDSWDEFLNFLFNRWYDQFIEENEEEGLIPFSELIQRKINDGAFMINVNLGDE